MLCQEKAIARASWFLDYVSRIAAARYPGKLVLGMFARGEVWASLQKEWDARLTP
jgi:hypothetical protein